MHWSHMPQPILIELGRMRTSAENHALLPLEPLHGKPLRLHKQRQVYWANEA